MSENRYYSIRMHASEGEKHVSGAERIVLRERIETTAGKLIARALSKDPEPGKIIITVEDLGTEQPRTLAALNVVTVAAPEPQTAKSFASQILMHSGVGRQAVRQAIHLLSNGASPDGGNMRGAVIMDAKTGNRFEPDHARGIRASRFDWRTDTHADIRQTLLENGLPHVRTFEALALATKIAHGPGVIAELCWSDDADYTAGYVASVCKGYIRFPFLKNPGDAKGGRVIFVDPAINVRELIDYLEKTPAFITMTGMFAQEQNIDRILKDGT